MSYQCIIEGCPGNHRSKWQVCEAMKHHSGCGNQNTFDRTVGAAECGCQPVVPITTPVIMNPREQIPDFDWGSLVVLRKRAGY
jgi:hypothetical protein